MSGPASLPLVSLAAGLVAATACRVLAPVTTRSSWARRNFRGATVSLVAGPIFVGATAAVLLAVSLADRDGRRAVLAILAAVSGAGLVGWYDDAHGETHAKGLRGHARLLARGRITSGVVKVGGLSAVGLAVGLIARSGPSAFVLVDALVVAGSANLVNLFDLRPGRAIKIGLLAAAPLVVAIDPSAATALAAAAGAAAGVLPFDLRESVMLGDCGANALGAALGAGVVVAGNEVATVAVLVTIVALTLASELVSYSRIIDGAPPLRALDRLGRIPDAPATIRHD